MKSTGLPMYFGLIQISFIKKFHTNDNMNYKNEVYINKFADYLFPGINYSLC